MLNLTNQKQELLDLQNEYAAYDLFTKCMHANGISYDIIKRKLPVINNEIAKVLGDELIKELQSASKIRLRVNPKNHGAIPEHVGSSEHIEVISDSAVSEGGVIVISDAGNIDAQISKRFQRVKRQH